MPSIIQKILEDRIVSRGQKRSHIKVEDEAVHGEVVESTITDTDILTENTKRPCIKVEDQTVKIKLDLDDEKERLSRTDRIYGDRVLLDRQTKSKGMMKLGAGNTKMVMFPKKNHPHREERFEKIGKLVAVAYSEDFNVDAPKYAGQRTASVRMLPHEKETDLNLDPHCVFSVFIKRTKSGKPLGWEYCGDYQGADLEVEAWRSAHSVPERKKKNMAKVTLRKNWGKKRIDEWRKKITEALQKDNSPASMAPMWFREKRVPTKEELKNYEPVPLAARARALGFRKDMTDEEFVKILYEFDELHIIRPIKFIEYREEVYDYVKDGPTNRNASGDKRKDGERRAIASDWYDYIDQYGDKA